MLGQPRYDSPIDALPDFLNFATHARNQLQARPEWRDWLLSEPIINPAEIRGAGKWKQDWILFGASPSASLDSNLDALRLLKQREYLRIGLLDFSGFATLQQTTRRLSDLADFFLEQVVELATRDLEHRFEKVSTPFTVLGMGKLGGQELNYSSDIDVIFVYGEEGELSSGLTYHQYFTRLSEQLIRAFSTSTGAGSLFRIDLRLRPEGNSGPLVRSLESCENYYAAFGETWERMALIKARVSAGNHELGYEFEQMRNAFSYVRSLSPEILDEIAALKARIEREVVGLDRLDLHVKLGTGGIREIEFIVQSLQLLHGARFPYLQRRQTLEVLDNLRTLDLLPPESTAELREAYIFWRFVEHRLQMVADLQTHTLPSDDAGRDNIARSLGMARGDFETAIQKHRTDVRRIFDQVVQTPSRPAPVFAWPGNIFLDLPAADRHLKTLREGSTSSHVAPRTLRSFERLWPQLVQQLQSAADPDTALTRFVRFVDAYGSRALLYESLSSNPKALELLIRLFDNSRFFSDVLFARPELFEEAARSGTLDLVKTKADYWKDLQRLSGDPALESRRYRRAELLRIFLRDILNLAPLAEIHSEYTALAEACLELAIVHSGHKSPVAIIGLGKLGGADLGYGSDLDCVAVGEDSEAMQKISQFMTATLPTGILFPLDFRLRPNGEGPLAVPVEAYVDYYENHAQFWEIQALTRARAVAGDAALGREFMKKTDGIWRKKCAENSAFDEIARMRRRIEIERVNHSWPEGEFKTGAGGLIDVEFGVQAWLMHHQIREAGTLEGLDRFATEHPETAAIWKEGYAYLRAVESALRRDHNSPVSILPSEAIERTKLAHRFSKPDWESFMTEYRSWRTRIRERYALLMPPVPH